MRPRGDCARWLQLQRFNATDKTGCLLLLPKLSSSSFNLFLLLLAIMAGWRFLSTGYPLEDIHKWRLLWWGRRGPCWNTLAETILLCFIASVYESMTMTVRWNFDQWYHSIKISAGLLSWDGLKEMWMIKISLYRYTPVPRKEFKWSWINPHWHELWKQENCSSLGA